MSRSPEPEPLDRLFAEVCRLKHAHVHSRLKGLGLYRGQPAVLRALWEKDGLAHTELARRLGVQPATITKMIRRMERSGFVERRPDQRDQRVSRVYLTEAGQAVREKVLQIWQALDEEAFAGFTPEERELLHGFFSRIRENLQRATGG